MTARALVTAILAAAALTGCASQPVNASDPGSNPTAVPAGATVAYQLSTHCGIGWEYIGGRWFEAQPPLSDGAGNAPQGWGNPYDAGTITMLSATKAEFRDPAGHSVILVLQPDATGPPHFCD
jgi:hypothetical protein